MAHPLKANRADRLHPDKPSDSRTAGQRDRDRILYTSAFRRLAGVTQVVAADEGHVFHNRLTHSLEVAQFGRRLAEKLIRENPVGAEAVGGVDPDVVESAGLAHDLGHPPFGHVAEQELNQLVTHSKVMSGFEGNAQSFRIITKLALQSSDKAGLNLTRATLNATLKYPWLRGTGGSHQLKWGAYQTEKRELDWARELAEPGNVDKSAEARLMDWADDVTYAVHDATDFYRAGLIPLDRLASVKDESERKRFLNEVFDRPDKSGFTLGYSDRSLEKVFEDLIIYFPIDEPYQATRDQRADLRSYTSSLIARYINAVELSPSEGVGQRGVSIDPEREKEVIMWKQLTWHYVILNPSLATQQFGQRKIIRDLFDTFLDAATDQKDVNVFPVAYREQIENPGSDKDSVVRTIADLISSFTERQTIALHRRLTGASLGSVLDRVELG